MKNLLSALAVALAISGAAHGQATTFHDGRLRKLPRVVSFLH